MIQKERGLTMINIRTLKTKEKNVGEEFWTILFPNSYTNEQVNRAISIALEYANLDLDQAKNLSLQEVENTFDKYFDYMLGICKEFNRKTVLFTYLRAAHHCTIKQQNKTYDYSLNW